MRPILRFGSDAVLQRTTEMANRDQNQTAVDGKIRNDYHFLQKAASLFASDCAQMINMNSKNLRAQLLSSKQHFRRGLLAAHVSQFFYFIIYFSIY